MFDFGGFDFGASSLPAVTSLVPNSTPAISTGTASSSSSGNWWQTLINDGLNAYNMVTRNNLASQQIKAGQSPTVLGLPGANTLSSALGPIVLLIIVVLVIVMVLK